MRRVALAGCGLWLALSACVALGADLRLVPYPRRVVLRGAGLSLLRPLRVHAPNTAAGVQAGRDVLAELRLAGARGTLKLHRAPGSRRMWWLEVGGPAPRASAPVAALPAQSEGYRLAVDRLGARVEARTEAGLLRGAATLSQLLRANVGGRALPGVGIVDYPVIRRRGFLDDITRGPSPTLGALKRRAQMAAYLRLNFMTYYLEHQYHHARHPDIGPPGGSLLPQELSALVSAAAARGIEVIGCQQSFGHFGHILAKPRYARLRETPDVIDPTNEQTYALLNDLYAGQAPLTRSPLFNVCCDETWGLGTGPSRALAERIGVGGVYAQHVTRLHRLLRERYGKRMMMWGDILLQHPDQIARIPPDTVMLSWGYHAADSFEPAIIPFKKAGFTFFVCPGTSNWSMVLPLIDVSRTNIRNYVRDGARHGTAGVLTTTWNDDGETLFESNWYGLAWSAECAWNGSRTRVEDFDRRVGAVLFGERGARFGRAVGLLARAQALPGYAQMSNARFWQPEAGRPLVTRPDADRDARGLLARVDPAIAELTALRREARANHAVVDHFLFGARRMRLVATRTLDRLRAADAYEDALAAGDPGSARARLADVRAIVAGVDSAYRGLRADQRCLWLQDVRPYALDRVLARYDATIARHGAILASLDGAVRGLAGGAPLPDPASLGLRVVEMGRPRTKPVQSGMAHLRPDAPWAVPALPSRLGVTVGPAREAMADVPVELDLPPAARGARAYRLVEWGPAEPARAVPCQVSTLDGTPRLLFVLRGALPTGTRRTLHLYYGAGQSPPVAVPGAVRLERRADGKMEIENGQVRLLLGPEGAHFYRWEVAALGGTDLTEPGEAGWAGFGDITGLHRSARNRLEVLSAGPVMARVRCTDPHGLGRTYDLWAGVSWVNCRLNTARNWFACYDDIRLMGSSSATPGRYLFEDGQTGPVLPFTNDVSSQVRRDGQRWCAKFVPDGAFIGLLTPEVPVLHVVGPGGPMGAVVVEGGAATAHFVMVGARSPTDPAAWMRELRSTLDYTSPPVLAVHAAQEAP